MNKRTIMYIIMIVILVLGLSLAVSNAGDTMRCGNELFVSDLKLGVSKHAVEEACGEPFHKTYYVWTYKMAGVEYYVKFDGRGRLAFVQSGDRR